MSECTRGQTVIDKVCPIQLSLLRAYNKQNYQTDHFKSPCIGSDCACYDEDRGCCGLMHKEQDGGKCK